MVFEYGDVGVDWAVFRHGYLQVDIVLYHGVYRTSGIMVISESIRRCWVLRQLPACVGLAGG